MARRGDEDVDDFASAFDVSRVGGLSTLSVDVKLDARRGGPPSPPQYSSDGSGDEGEDDVSKGKGRLYPSMGTGGGKTAATSDKYEDDDKDDDGTKEGGFDDERLAEAEAGDRQAQFERGQWCRRRWPDSAEFVMWLRRAAEQDHARANAELWHVYAEGVKKAVQRDAKEAMRFLTRAADLGDPESQRTLGLAYLRGSQALGTPCEPARAVPLLERAADQGDADSQRYLGFCYFKGVGVEQDQAKAVRHWRVSADQGNVTSLENLAKCFSNGYGVAVDRVEARRLLKVASQQRKADRERAKADKAREQRRLKEAAAAERDARRNNNNNKKKG